MTHRVFKSHDGLSTKLIKKTWKIWIFYRRRRPDFFVFIEGGIRGETTHWPAPFMIDPIIFWRKFPEKTLGISKVNLIEPKHLGFQRKISEIFEIWDKSKTLGISKVNFTKFSAKTLGISKVNLINPKH